MQKGSAHTDCIPGLVKQDRVSALEGVQRSLRANNSMDADRYKEPKYRTTVKIPSWEEI